MAGTIVTDRIESDASYASSINIASPMVVSNTLTMGSAAAITGNVNFDSGTLFVDSVNNRVGVGTQNPEHLGLHVKPGAVVIEGDGTSSGYKHLNLKNGSTFWHMSGPRGDEGGASANCLSIFYHNGTSYNGPFLKIDTAGRVTMPYTPAFEAFASASASTWTAGNTIIFNNDVYANQGSGYSTSTGRFTAPVTGYYHFHYQTWKINSSALVVRPLKNGSDMNDTFWMYNSSAQASESNTCQFTVYLAASDYIEINVYSGTNGGDYTNFGGFLIG